MSSIPGIKMANDKGERRKEIKRGKKKDAEREKEKKKMRNNFVHRKCNSFQHQFTVYPANQPQLLALPEH